MSGTKPEWKHTASFYSTHICSPATDWWKNKSRSSFSTRYFSCISVLPLSINISVLTATGRSALWLQCSKLYKKTQNTDTDLLTDSWEGRDNDCTEILQNALPCLPLPSTMFPVNVAPSLLLSLRQTLVEEIPWHHASFRWEIFKEII